MQFSYIKKTESFFNHRHTLSEHAQKRFLDKQFFKYAGYHLNFSDPKTFNEKLNWLKLYWQHPLLTLHADKYMVRDIVKEKIGEKYLVPLLGAWDKPEDIDFDRLPEQFVLKVNWGSGQNILVKDKSLLNKNEALALLRAWLKPENNHYWAHLEWCYKNIQPKIIAEQYVNVALCYHILCFNGEPMIVRVVYNDKQPGEVKDSYNIHWERLSFRGKSAKSPTPFAKPFNFPEMLEIAKTLANPFPFARIDLLSNNNGEIFFSECTFHPGGGTTPRQTEWELKLGAMIQLPEKHIQETKLV